MSTYTNTDNFTRPADWHRRKFIRTLAALAGVTIGLETLVACGDATSTPGASAATTSQTTTAATTPTVTTTTAPATTAAAMTTANATTVAMTTAPATTSAAATSAASPSTTTAAASGDAPAGYTSLGAVDDLKKLTAPKAITVGDKKGFVFYQEQFYVYSNICTHKGCEIAYDAKDKEYECPCHGSQYTLSGQVKKGPAKDPLAIFDYKIANNNLYVKA